MAESGSLSPSPLSIRKQREERGNTQSIADFLNESRISPDEAEALRTELESAASACSSRSMSRVTSKENIKIGHESRIGSIRRKVSSVITTFAITPPRPAPASTSASIISETPTKSVKKLARDEVEDPNQDMAAAKRTLSVATTPQVATPPGTSGDAIDFLSVPYETTSPLHPEPRIDRASPNIRRKPLLSLNTALNKDPYQAARSALFGGKTLDDPFSIKPVESPPKTHPLIKASNSWASEAFGDTEVSKTFELSGPPSACSSNFQFESQIEAIKKQYAAKAQELKAQNGEDEVFDDDHPAVKNFERAIKARASGVNTPVDSCPPSLTASLTITPDLERQHTKENIPLGSASTKLVESARSSQSSANSAKKRLTSTDASHTSLLLGPPANSEQKSPLQTKARESYDHCCQGVEVDPGSSTSRNVTPFDIIDPNYEPRQESRQFSFLKKLKSPPMDTTKEVTIDQKILDLRKRTGTEVVYYQRTDERCRHPNHTRTWYSKK